MVVPNMAVPSSVLFIVCVLSTICSLCSIFTYIKSLPSNTCDMTYMFQYPEYIEIKLRSKVTKRFPKYRLFIYGEGYYADSLRNGVFDGIPVLFIPGNAGSYRQVRSLASVSMVKTEQTPASPKFNYFSIDFDEELSGLYGGYLEPQTEFASLCIKKIFRFYPEHIRSKLQIILIGHSVGGLISRGVVSLNYIDSRLISYIFTLATPNVKPVISFDPYMTKYYESIDERTTHHERNKIFYVSVGGGFRDVLVRSDLTQIKTIENNRSINSISSSLTNVWSSTDHLCIVWCNQLVRLIVRALFEVCDEKFGVIDDVQKMNIFTYHFTNSLGPFSALSYLKNDWRTISVTNLNTSNVDEEYNFNDLKIIRYNSESLIKYFKVCFNDRIRNKVLFLRTSQDLYCILYSCSSEGFCNCAGEHNVLPFSSKFIIIQTPAQFPLCYYAPVHSLRSASDHFLFATYDENNNDDRSDVIKVGNPFWWTYSRELNGSLLFYNFSLEHFSTVIQAYNVKLIPIRCRSGFFPNGILNIVRFHCPWNNAENLYQNFRFPYNQSDDFVIRYQFVDENRSENAQLNLFFDPNCEYQLILSSNFLVSLGQITRFYFAVIPNICISIIVSVLIFKISKLHLRYGPPCVIAFYAIAIYNKTDDHLFGDIMLFLICIGIVSIIVTMFALVLYVLKMLVNYLRRCIVRR